MSRRVGEHFIMRNFQMCYFLQKISPMLQKTVELMTFIPILQCITFATPLLSIINMVKVKFCSGDVIDFVFISLSKH